MKESMEDRILAIIRQWPSATVRLIGEQMGFASPSSVQWYLTMLRDRGLIWRGRCECCNSEIWMTRDAADYR